MNRCRFLASTAAASLAVALRAAAHAKAARARAVVERHQRETIALLQRALA